MKRLFVVAAIAALFLGGQAFAGYSFDDISESSPTGDSPPLTFGTPTIYTFPNSSLTIADWDPTGFSASVSGVGTDFSDGRLQFTINSFEGDVISQVDFRESGAFGLVNGGASVEYGLTVVATVKAIDGQAAHVPLDEVTVSGSKSTPGIGNWRLTLNMDIAEALGNLGVSGNATSVEFEVNNTLIAHGTEATSGAFIDKKDFTVAVPEPSSFLFLGLVASGALVWQKKRRNDLIEA